MKHANTDDGLRAAAQERLFETALAEAVTDDPLAESLPESQPATSTTLRTAAALLLGIGVAISVWWLRQSRKHEAWQQPAPIPIATAVDNGTALRTLDRNTVAIRIEAAMPEDLAVLPEFPGLRSISMNPNFTNAGQRAWQQAGPETLEPLTRCPNLEVLELPFAAQLDTPHLELLGRCQKLRTFEVRGKSLRIDRKAVAELAKWPALSRLRLLGSPMTAAGIRELRSLPHLHTLELSRCNDLDDGPFEAITGLDRLRTLRITASDPNPPRARVSPPILRGNPTFFSCAGCASSRTFRA